MVICLSSTSTALRAEYECEYDRMANVPLRHAGPMMVDCQPGCDPGVACSRLVRQFLVHDTHALKVSRGRMAAITITPKRNAATTETMPA